MATTRKKKSAAREQVPSYVWTWKGKPPAKLALVYFNTAPDRNVVGLMPLELEVLKARTGMTEQQAMAGIVECVRDGYLAEDGESVLLLDRWERASKTAGERMEAINILAETKSTLTEVFFALYPDMRRAVEAAQRIARGGQGEVVSNIPADFPLFMLDVRLEEQWQKLVESWRAAHAAVNVDAELQSAHEWLLANKGKKKGARTDMVRFLHNWMRRADKGGAATARVAEGRKARDAARARFGGTW